MVCLRVARSCRWNWLFHRDRATRVDGGKRVDLTINQAKCWLSGWELSDSSEGILLCPGVLTPEPMVIHDTIDCPRGNPNTFEVELARQKIEGYSILSGRPHAGQKLNSSLVFSRSVHSTRPSEVRLTLPLMDVKPFALNFGDGKDLRQRIDAAVSQTERELCLDELKKQFDRDERPVFAASCLILPDQLRHRSTEFIHTQTNKRLKRPPTYLSFRDVMLAKKEMPNRDYMRFRDQIISSRVHLIDNWQSTFSNVEKLYYDYGVKGPSDGVDIYKGECDASFDSNSKTATLAFIIWKDDKVLWSQVIRGFDCGSAQEAEACAALALVWKATELEKGTITNLIVYTDSMPTAGIMSGSMTIKRNDRNFGLYMLLRGTRQRFDRLIAEWKSRELQFLPDALASSQDVDYGPLYTGTILKKFSYHLSGLPLFKLSQSTKSKEITSKFVSRKYNEALDSRYYLVVENKDQFAALAKVTRTLKPGLVYAAIHNIECKPTDFQQKAYGFSGAAQIGEFTFSFAKFNFHSEDTDTTGPKGARPIIFVFDLTVPEASYAHLNGFTIFLVSPKERGVMRSRGIRELNALSYIYYHGVIEGGDSLEAEGDGGEEPGEEVLAVSLSHPKFWWGPDLAWPRRGEILSMKSKN